MTDVILMKRFFVLVKQHGLDEEGRHELIYKFTNGRTHSLKETNRGEVERIIESLTGASNEYKKACDAGRKRLIAKAAGIGESVDFVAGWCEKHGINPPHGGATIYKKFNDYNTQELFALAEKFERTVVEDRLRKVRKEV